MGHKIIGMLGGVALCALASTPGFASHWNVYIPPPPYSETPPVFSASTWVLAQTADSDDPTADPFEFDPDNGDIDCNGAAQGVHTKYYGAGDKDASQRALQAVCVSQETGKVIPTGKH
jgi:hypothetical protein